MHENFSIENGGETKSEKRVAFWTAFGTIAQTVLGTLTLLGLGATVCLLIQQNRLIRGSNDKTDAALRKTDSALELTRIQIKSDSISGISDSIHKAISDTASNRTAKAAQQSVQIAANSFAITDRPYIDTRRVRILIGDTPSNMKIDHIIGNYGRAPAYKIKIIGCLSILPENDTIWKHWKDCTSMIGRVSCVMPQDSSRFEATVKFGSLLTRADLLRFHSDRTYPYYFGRVTYYGEGENKENGFRFCRYYRATDSLWVDCAGDTLQQTW